MKEIEIKSEIRNGGLNSDDHESNAPINDYQEAKNLYPFIGDNFLRKLKGNDDDFSTISFNGVPFGLFEINQEIFVVSYESPYHYVYRVKRGDKVGETVFQGKLDLDPTLPLKDGVLVNGKTLVLNNQVDEICKVELNRFLGMYITENSTIPMEVGTTGGAFTVGTYEGFVSFNLSDSNQYWGSQTENYIFVFGYDDMDTTLLKTYHPLINNKVFGEFVEPDIFKTNIEVEGSIQYSGDQYFGQITDKDSPKSYYIGEINEHYLINIPHLDPPEVSYTTDPLKKKNNINSDHFKFQVQYLYDDNTYSVWSPISDSLLIPTHNELTYFDNNGIVVSAKAPSYYEAYGVKTVVFGVIKNDGVLYEFDRVDVVRNTSAFETLGGDISTVFYNDTVLIAIEEKERLSLFDSIFPKTSSIELFNKTNLAFSGVDREFVPIEPVMDLTLEKTPLNDITPTDYVHAFNYTGPTSRTKKTNSDVNNGYFVPTNARSIYVQNRTTKGVVSDASAPDDVLIASSYQQITRYKEPTSAKTHLFYEFSATQVVGTIYEFYIEGHELHPEDYSYRGRQFAHRAKFVCKTTSTQDLIDDIVAWFGSIPNQKYGHTGDYIEFYAYDQTGGTHWWTDFEKPPGEFAIVLTAGLQCVHSIDKHYHWHQVKRMNGFCKKTTALGDNIRSLKSNVDAIFLAQYYDKFNRIVGNAIAGTVSVGSFIEEDNDVVNNSVAVRIYNDPPPNAARLQFAYSGNSAIKQNYFFVAGTVTDGGSYLNVPISFDAFNESVGGDLSYSFTKGDLIIRRRSAGFTNLTGDDTIPVRIVSEDSGVLKVVKSDSNPIATGDLLEIITPAISTNEEDRVWNEIPHSIKIVDGVHQGDISKGDDGLYAYSLAASSIRETAAGVEADNYPGKTSIVIPTSSEPYNHDKIALNGYLDILNGPLTGKHEVLDWFIIGSDSVFIINYDYNGPNDPNFLDPTYITTKDAITTSSPSLTVNYSEFSIDNFGDVYLRYRDTGYSTRVESFAIDDKSGINEWAKGRPTVLINANNIDLSSIIFYSEDYYNNVELNGLSTVFQSNFFEYDSTYGVIKKIVAKDDRLYLFRDRKISYAYINKNLISDANDNQLQSLGDKLSETETFIIDDIGIGNQLESTKVYGDAIYFADDINLLICRMIGDKIEPISSTKKMHKYFSEALSEANINVRIDYDYINKNVIVHLKSDSRNEQAIYSEIKERWVSILSLDSLYAGFNEDIYSVNSFEFESNTYYGYFVHDNEAERNNFKGAQLVSSLKQSINGGSESYKLWLAVQQDPLFTDVTSLKINLTNDEGQLSEISSDSFKREGSGYWAEILRDKNTTDMGALDPLIEGDPMRSKTITIELKSSSQADTPLDTVTLRYVDIIPD